MLTISAAQPASKTSLLVVRHGETEWNAQQRFQGHADSCLTALGIDQAAAVGRRLRQFDFQHLICSDLGRARQTAALISAQTGHTVQSDPRLRERHYGVLEGLNLTEIRGRFTDIYTCLTQNDPDYAIPEGESHASLYGRNVAFVEEYLSAQPGTSAVLVVHGGVLDSLFRYTARLPLNQPRCFTSANAGLSIFSHGIFHGSARWVIQTWNDVGHLTPVEPKPGSECSG
jgi:2,3-bisphosphoglycerate-dependent phosphoglycerate mutase